MCFYEVNLEQTQIHFACVSQTWWSGLGTLLLKKPSIAKHSFEPLVNVILKPGIQVGNVTEQ